MDEKDLIKERIDIVDLIGEYVDLKKSGREWKGLCPFHEERTPSFYVIPHQQRYYCFGCHAQGDAFDFLGQKAGMPFIDALQHLAGRAGVTLRQPQRLAEEHRRDRPYREALAFAAQWFIQQLADPAGGAAARDYLDRRGVSVEARERFGIGWAPDEWRGLRDAAARHGIQDDVLGELGLIKKSKKAIEPYDQFRGRIIFPIRSKPSEVVGFSGRIIGSDGPKYLNSSESRFFKKSRLLYGFAESNYAIRSSERAIVVEGQMDLVSMASAGFDNVVAPLGTALTDEQAKLLKNAREVILLYDSDSAGLRATFKAGDILLRNDLTPAVVTLPPGEDPDTVIQKEGADGLRRYMAGAVGVLDRKIQMMRDRGMFATIQGRRLALDKLLPTLRAVADPALLDLYIAEASRCTEVRPETLRDQVDAARAAEASVRSDRGAESGAPGGSERPARSPRSPRSGWTGGVTDRMGPSSTLLRVLAQDRERRQEHLEYALDRIGPEDFKNEAERSIFQAFLDDPDLETPPDHLEESTARYLRTLLVSASDPDEFGGAGHVLHSAVLRMQVDRLYGQMDRVQEAIAATDDRDEKLRLLQEKARLRAEAEELGVRWTPSARKHAQGFNE